MTPKKRELDAVSARRTGSSNADRRRHEIIDRAAELFDRHGYHQTSVDDIAAAVGIRKPTLYHYFSGKEEILYMIHEEFARVTVARQEERAREDVAPTENLFLLINDLVSLLDTHPGHVRVYFEYGRELSPEYDREIKRLRRRYHGLVEDVVRRGVERGEFRELNVRLTVMAFFGMCNWTYQWYRRGGRLKAQDVAEGFHDVFVRGIAVDGAPPAAAALASAADPAARANGR